MFCFAHQGGGMLQQDQLCCPQLHKLAISLESSKARDSEGGRQCCSLLHLARLAVLHLMCSTSQATMDLRLPATLQQLTVQDNDGGLDLKWVLREAGKLIRRGAHLCSLTCAGTSPSPHPEGTPWGASSAAHFRDLAEQLRGLKALCVYGRGPTLLSAVGAMACSAPDLAHLTFRVEEPPDARELTPISSPSLESITAIFKLTGHVGPPPLVILTFLPGCSQLRDVRVQFYSNIPRAGTSVKIRCHCSSQDCIMPSDACAGLEELGVQFLPMPPSSQGVQAYTVIFTCYAAGPEQALRWGHFVLPGIV